MRNLHVSGGYADFKLVVAALGKPTSVFWWKEDKSAQIVALLEDHTTVKTVVPLPAAASPVSPIATAGTASPLGPAPVDASKPAAVSDSPGVSPDAAAKPAAPEKPKTVLETDFPGAIELPGGAIVFS